MTKINTNMLNQTSNVNFTGNVALTGANVSLGSIANVHITGGSSGQYISTDGAGNLSFASPASGSGTYQAIAAGTLSDGTKVIINSDGTVSAITATAQSLGAQQTYAQGGGSINTPIVSAYDPTTGKILIIFRTGAGNNLGYIGTITNGSLTLDYGYTLSNLSGTLNYFNLIYISSNTFFVCYIDSSTSNVKGNIITISGNTITTGTASTISSGTNYYPSCTYDNVNQRIIVTCTHSTLGNIGYAGTVSGTTLSWGGYSVLVSGSIIGKVIYNQASKKILFVYTSTGTGYCTTLNLNGANLNDLGSSIQFNAANYSSPWNATGQSVGQDFVVNYDPYSKQVVILFYTKNYGGAWVVYGDGSVWRPPILLPSTVSGNNNAPFLSISKCLTTNRQVLIFSDTGYTTSYYASILLETDGTATITNPITVSAIIYNGSIVGANLGQALIMYGQSTLTYHILQLPTTTLTSTNFLGISDGNYTNGQTATIQTAGAVDDAQSGLTPGQKYYVQNNGTLSTTPGNPNVYAGVAVSNTKLIVKG